MLSACGERKAGTRRSAFYVEMKLSNGYIECVRESISRPPHTSTLNAVHIFALILQSPKLSPSFDRLPCLANLIR